MISDLFASNFMNTHHEPAWIHGPVVVQARPPNRRIATLRYSVSTNKPAQRNEQSVPMLVQFRKRMISVARFRRTIAEIAIWGGRPNRCPAFWTDTHRPRPQLKFWMQFERAAKQ